MALLIVITWYWKVWTPFLTSSYTSCSTSNSLSSSDNEVYFEYFSIARCLVTSTNGAKAAHEWVCPPYWVLLICKAVCAIRLHAVEKLCGESIFAAPIWKPFVNISKVLTKQQLCIGWTGA